MRNEGQAGPDGRGRKSKSRRFRACVPRRLSCRNGCSLGGIKQFCHKGTLYLFLWILWMIMGTLYYSYVNHLGVSVGFYQAVNIGYSIGYGYPREPMEQNWWFSSFYVIMGASFVGIALGFFADKIVEDSQDWFMHMIQKQKYEENIAPDKPFPIRAKAFIKYNWAPIRSILLCCCWWAVMIIYSMISVKWPFSAAQYFAISTCSTGGHMPIPDDSPEWLFGVTGFFAALGVPLMGVAMASLGSLLMERRDDMDEMKATIEADVTAEELLDLQRFGLEDGDGEIDRAEFVILCMVRLGTDPRLVQFISEQFQKLDDDNSNSLSILEITKGRVSCEDLQKLGQSEEYLNKRRMSDKRSLSLSSIPEAQENDNESPASLSSHPKAQDSDKGSRTSLSSIPEAHGDKDEENQNGTHHALAKPHAAKKVANENITAETECEVIPEEGVDDTFEDNALQSDGSEEGGFFDSFQDNESPLHENEGGIFF